MHRRRWLRQLHWAWDSGYGSKADAMMRKMRLQGAGDEVVVRKEGRRFNVFARVKA